MNIYVVLEDQFPDAQLIMICECHDEEQAKLAYYRLWFPIVAGDISSVTCIGEGVRDTPALLWKNFNVNKEIKESEQTKKIENGTEQEDNTEDSTVTTSEE